METVNTLTTLHFAGDVTEDFQGPSIPTESDRVVINLRGVRRINSAGVRGWIVWCQSALTGKSLTFENCSFSVIQQAASIANFLPGEVTSYEVPYFCEACDTNFNKMVATNAPLPTTDTCPNCGKSMELDFPGSLLEVFHNS